MGSLSELLWKFYAYIFYKWLDPFFRIMVGTKTQQMTNIVPTLEFMDN